MTSLSEFSLIKHYFSELTASRPDVVLGIGDDCAILACAQDQHIAVSIDTLVEGVHFFADVDPETLGHKSLAVGLSDLAAMGAKPAWFTLALSLPEVNESWLKSFSKGLAELAAKHNIQLVGGDTTRGPLTISIQVHGFVEKTQVMRRDAAKTGDLIYVSGTLGDAGAALKMRLNNWLPEQWTEQDKTFLQQRLEKPTPRNQLAAQLLPYAHAGIDISDGLLADLGHILQRSHVGAVIYAEQLPLSNPLKQLPQSDAQALALTSGDDYELCFTVPVESKAVMDSMAEQISCIGYIVAEEGLTVLDKQQDIVNLDTLRIGYDHFPN